MSAPMEPTPMAAMRHGYTNQTVTDGRVVVRTYQSPDRAARQEREERALLALVDVLPVPELVASAVRAVARGGRGRERARGDRPIGTAAKQALSVYTGI